MMNKLITAAALATATVALTTAPAADVDAALPVCRDSNGSAPGGSVYLSYYTTYFVCDVVPPQRLHLTRTPSNAACLDAGGHGWTSTYRICWDVDH